MLENLMVLTGAIRRSKHFLLVNFKSLLRYGNYCLLFLLIYHFLTLMNNMGLGLVTSMFYPPLSVLSCHA